MTSSVSVGEGSLGLGNLDDAPPLVLEDAPPLAQDDAPPLVLALGTGRTAMTDKPWRPRWPVRALREPCALCSPVFWPAIRLPQGRSPTLGQFVSPVRMAPAADRILPSGQTWRVSD